MSQQFTSVAPGDLITAKLMNQLLSAVADLENRITSLETGTIGGDGKPVIMSLTPSDSVVMGEQLRVVGRGLSPDGLVSVTIGSSTVHGITGDDRHIVFNVPAVLGIPTGGGVATLTVANAKGEDKFDLFVLPAQPTTLDAVFIVKNTERPSEKLKPNTTYDLVFTITATTSIQALYTLIPSVDGNGWTAVIKTGETEIPIPRSSPTPSQRTVIVTVMTGASGSATLRLGIKAKQFPDQQGQSDPVDLAVDQTPIAINTEISFLTPPARVGAGFDAASNLITIVATQTGTVGVRAQLKTKGVKYQIMSVLVDPKPDDWTPVLATTSPFTTTIDNEVKRIDINLTPNATAAPATLKVKLKRDGSTEPDAEFLQSIARK